ncbi:PQQ-dependent sugar dehydrogenase [Marinivivus vitaminiproducens]|uniref:PQQ-dependent sugar dehydrogenase n=1 Tax=Marinivivus vitaminiproducens TaxID=3035935 RepID=UPI0027A58A18|nr:PQQ-dependent sugar dehydrogenase [Geminicoccaceae bacterium SCSIO 64248]
MTDHDFSETNGRGLKRHSMFDTRTAAVAAAQTRRTRTSTSRAMALTPALVATGKTVRVVAKTLTFALLSTASSALTSGGAAQPSTTSPATRLTLQGTPGVVVSGLHVPWSVVIAGNEALVSQRDTAEILAFRPGEPPRLVGKVPDVTARLDGGLLGLAVLDEGGDTWVYAHHSTASANRIVRMPYTAGALGEVEVVLEGIPGGRGHNGGRIAFGPDGMLYAATGEAQDPDLSQDPESLGGKILRMTPDGDVPDDNPIAGSLVYSLGHRNPQGLTWDDYGQLWATDFGDDAWDELNRVEPGGNYGWPIVEGRGGKPDYVDPVVQWGTQEMGPSGLVYVDGTFFLAGLTGERLWSVTFDIAGYPVTVAHYIGKYGRIRHVLAGVDGDLWFVTNNTDGRGDTPSENDDRILSVPLAPTDAP